MTHTFKYPIFADRTYTLEYDFGSIEITGEEILAMFYRGAYLDKVLEDLSTDTEYDCVLDIGEL